jgi:hypothetical protein
MSKPRQSHCTYLAILDHLVYALLLASLLFTLIWKSTPIDDKSILHYHALCRVVSLDQVSQSSDIYVSKSSANTSTPPENCRTRSACSFDWDGQIASVSIEYLANGAAELDKANEVDPETKRRLHEALATVVASEKRSQAKIEQAMQGA